MTHRELVDKAFEWASNRHNLTIKERGAGSEIPDVFAFAYGYTTLIECKVSRSDFFHDKKKYTRRYGESCIGNYRIYCAPKGLLTENDIPNSWGLLEAYPSGLLKLNVNIFKGASGLHSDPHMNTIWWHEDTVASLRQEKHILLNHFLFPKV